MLIASRPPSRSFSLRRRLLLLLLPAITTVWLLSGYYFYGEIEEEMQEIMDAELAQTAHLLAALALPRARHEADRRARVISRRDMAELYNRYEHQISFRVVDLEGRVILASPDAPAGLGGVVNGQCETHALGETEWRLFGLQRPTGWVYAGTPLDVRDEITTDFLMQGPWLVLVTLLVLAGVVWWSVGRGLRPLDAIADEVSARHADDLSPLHVERAPSEVRPLAAALNHLFNQLGKAFEHERRFTADAAHELRTPLAAVRIQAEVARRASDAESRERALSQVLTGIDRATHLTVQLLTLARADAQTAAVIHQGRADLAEVAESVIIDLAGRAAERDIDLGLDQADDGDWTVPGDAAALGILMRNLVDNAIRYTPTGGAVGVSLSRGEGTRLAVTDTGPGIPESERAGIFDRFRRGSSAGQAAGSGLGLSIVERIAGLHGARVKLDSGPGGVGLRVEVSFPVGEGDA